ncbi:MAG: hypothetical protein ACXV7J_00425 [Methylomonas sp.]
MKYSYLDFQQRVPVLNADLDIGAYYGNAALAGRDSVGFQFNMEIPLGNILRLNRDYLWGINSVSATTLKLLCPLGKNWH